MMTSSSNTTVLVSDNGLPYNPSDLVILNNLSVTDVNYIDTISPQEPHKALSSLSNKSNTYGQMPTLQSPLM
jgi:hypothetical protein